MNEKLETRIYVDTDTEEEMGSISFPPGTPEKMWENSLNGFDNVKWKMT